MADLCIDIGNTRAKVGWFVGQELGQTWTISTATFAQELERLLLQNSLVPDQVAWLTTARIDKLEDLPVWKRFREVPRFFEISAQTPFPINNQYATPETLGPDRLVGVVAARASNPHRAVLVIDVGTAITYDFADERGSYLGGGISPGMSMRFRALEAFTARLPLVEAGDIPVDLIGDSTWNSIRSGVINGIIAEIDGVVDRYQSLAGGNVMVYLCGGDMPTFENQLKSVNFADSNLILRGISLTLSANPI